jgi:hypothetical protein
MCQGGELARLKDACMCGALIDDRLLSKKEILTRLREYQKTLESELDAVNENVESTAIAAEGGD